MMGLGQYADVSYSCEGMVLDIDKYSFIDYGGSISHNIDMFKFGLRGGGFSINGPGGSYYTPEYPYEAVSTGEFSAQYVNPFIAFDHKYVELSFGILFLTDYPLPYSINEKFINEGTTQLTWLLRIGNQRAFHFSSHYLSNVPIFSGGGMFDIGVGFGSKESRNLTWVGLSGGPFQNAGLGVKQTIQVSKHFDILIKGRIGQIESNLEASISAGASYNF
jgi:hypothetical protein